MTHNVWTADWRRLLITLFGWTTLLRALINIFRPQWVVMTGSAIWEHRCVFFGARVLNLLIGPVLTYLGYTALA